MSCRILVDGQLLVVGETPDEVADQMDAGKDWLLLTLVGDSICLVRADAVSLIRFPLPPEEPRGRPRRWRRERSPAPSREALA